jgi:WD40 repeat protein
MAGGEISLARHRATFHRLAWIVLVMLPVGPLASADEPPGPPRVDAYGDPLPAGVIARIGSTRFLSDSSMEWLGFTPDGKRLLGHGTDIDVWDAATGKLLDKIPLPRNADASPFISPDGKILAVGLPGKVWFFDLATGKKQREEKVDGEDSVVLLQWSADGKQIQIFANEMAQVRNVENWNLIRDFRHGGYCLKTDTLALVEHDRRKRRSPSKLQLVRFIPGKDLWEKTWTDRTIEGRRLTPDGKLVVLQVNFYTEPLLSHWWILLDAANGTEICRFKSAATDLIFSPDEKTAVEKDGLRRAFRIADGKELATDLPPPRCFSRDGKLLACASDSRVVLVDTTTWRQAGEPNNPLEPLVILGSGKRVATRALCAEGVLIWESQTGRLLDRLPAVGVESLQALPDDHTVVVGTKGAISVWNIDQRKVIKRIPLDDGADVSRLSVSGDGKTAAVESDGSISVYSLESGQLRSRIEFKEPTDGNLALSYDGALLAAGHVDYPVLVGLGPYFTTVWDVATRQIVFRTKTGETSGEYPIRFIRGGYLLAHNVGGKDFNWQAIVREIASGAVVKRISWPSGDNNVGYTPDGRFAISRSRQGLLQFWSIEIGESVRAINTHQDFWGFILFPDGKRAATFSQGNTYLIRPFPNFEKVNAPSKHGLSENDIAALWRRLTGAPPDAYQASAVLVSGGDSVVEFVKRHWQMPAMDEARARTLIDELASDRGETRSQAAAALELIGPRTLPLLREARRGAAESSEAAKLLETLMLRVSSPTISDPEELRRVRAVDVLERIGTTPARELLTKISHGPPLARETRSAIGALDRLSSRPKGSE